MDDDVLGPIDYLAVEFPNGTVTGEGFRLLMDLGQRGIIRVLDLEFIARGADGTARKVALGDLDCAADVDVTVWRGAESDVLDQADFDTVASSIAASSVAGILIYENVWAAPLIAAIDRSGARIVGEGRVSLDDVLAALGSPDTART
jgi:hypothetical protein